MRTSTVQRSHRLSTKLLTLSLLCAIITVLQSQAVSSHQLSPSTHRLRVRADPAPTPAQPPAPPTTAPLPKAPIDPIQCGLTFEPGFAPGEQAACKNYGGFHYLCPQASCHILKDQKSDPAIGNINFENCQKYQGALGTSDLVTGKVKVLAIHILSYYYKQQLNPPIGTHTEWPERVDVVGYDAASQNRTVASSANYQCPLSEKVNLVRPWCFNCTHTDGKF